MLATLIIWLFTLILFYLYGQAALSGLRHVLHLDQEDIPTFPFDLLIGMIIVTISTSILNLFIPLGFISTIILFGGALIIGFVMCRQILGFYFVRHPLVWMFLALAFLTILENATHIPSSSDTALYHAQTIRWFETYRIVPGLGNLHHRLAFNSSWLVLNAAFSFAFLGIRSFHLMSGVLFLAVALYFAEGLEGLIQRKLSVSNFVKIILLPLSFYLFASEISSPATDMPVAFLTWVILLLWVEKLEGQSGMGLRDIGIFLLSIFALTIKLSAAPLLGFALLVLIEYIIKKRWQRALLLSALGILVLTPWIIRSVILSGYLVFPVSQIDLFSVDWKIPSDQVEAFRNAITGFARLPGKDWESSLNMTIQQWVPLWFGEQTLNQQFFFLIAMFSPLIFPVIRHRYPSITSGGYTSAYFVLYAGALFWFFSAPDLRFGYGFLAAICVLILSPLFVDLIAKTDKSLKLIPYLLFLFLILYQGYAYWRSFDLPTFRQRLLLPADYLSSRAQACEISNGTVFCRLENGQCNYDVFPCIATPHPFVEMRGPTFRDGFRSIH